MTDLDIIQPPGVSIKFGGKDVEIKPLKVGKLPAFARAVKPLGEVVGRLTLEFATFDVAAFLSMLADHGDQLIEAVAVGSGIPREEIEECSPDELLKVASAVIKVNADFFSGRLAPAILAAVKKTTGAGPTQSPS